MKTWRTFTLAVILVAMAASLFAGLTAWVPAGIGKGVLALAPPVAVALSLVAYFNWRERFRRRILGGEERGDDEMVTTALDPARAL